MSKWIAKRSYNNYPKITHQIAKSRNIYTYGKNLGTSVQMAFPKMEKWKNKARILHKTFKEVQMEYHKQKAVQRASQPIKVKKLGSKFSFYFI